MSNTRWAPPNDPAATHQKHSRANWARLYPAHPNKHLRSAIGLAPEAAPGAILRSTPLLRPRALLAAGSLFAVVRGFAEFPARLDPVRRACRSPDPVLVNRSTHGQGAAADGPVRPQRFPIAGQSGALPEKSD